MKIETKRRIIYFIKRLINYYETPPYIMIETKRIARVLCQHEYHQKDLLMISDAQVRYAAGSQILTELEKIGAIKYEHISSSYPEHTTVRAELNIVLP
jgi:hypothetical protein